MSVKDQHSKQHYKPVNIFREAIVVIPLCSTTQTTFLLNCKRTLVTFISFTTFYLVAFISLYAFPGIWFKLHIKWTNFNLYTVYKLFFSLF